jgi:hypothetical protein
VAGAAEARAAESGAALRVADGREAVLAAAREALGAGGPVAVAWSFYSAGSREAAADLAWIRERLDSPRLLHLAGGPHAAAAGRDAAGRLRRRGDRGRGGHRRRALGPPGPRPGSARRPGPRLAGARPLLAEALKLDPYDADALRVRALLQQGRGRCREAAFAWALVHGAGGVTRDELRARLAEIKGCIDAR